MSLIPSDCSPLCNLIPTPLLLPLPDFPHVNILHSLTPFCICCPTSRRRSTYCVCSTSVGRDIVSTLHVHAQMRQEILVPPYTPTNASSWPQRRVLKPDIGTRAESPTAQVRWDRVESHVMRARGAGVEVACEMVGSDSRKSFRSKSMRVMV